MQTIEAQVKIGVDRKLTIDLPDSVSMGEYEVVVVLNHHSTEQTESSNRENALAQRWEKWFEAVDRLPLLDNPDTF